MVIALLGVWTSVAVVWFELVDYEEVLGKLGIYDADGDGDFDVEDAKVLLGLKEKSVPEQPTVRNTEEVIQPVEEPHVRAERRSIPEPEPDDEIESALHEVLESQLEQERETDAEHIHEETHFQENEENNEIPDVPITEEEYSEEPADTISEVLESHGSLQEDPINDYEVEEPDVEDTPVTYEYHTHVEEGAYHPQGSDDTEFNLEDALDHNTETFPEDAEYADEHDLENEEFIEALETDEEPLTDHDDENIQDAADVPDSFTEHVEADEIEEVEDDAAAEPHETESPVQTEDDSNDERVDT